MDQDALPGGTRTSRSDVLVGAAVVAAAGAARAGRAAGRVLSPAVGVLLEPPLVPQRWRPRRAVDGLRRRGREQRVVVEQALRAQLARLAPDLVERALDLVPVTAVIREHVDLDALVASVDLDAVARRIDLEAVLARLDLTEVVTEQVDVNAVASVLDLDALLERLDLVALAREVIVAIDLPEIIRESSGSLVNESVRGVRMQSIDADRAVERLVDRLLRRHGTPGDDEPDGSEQAAEPDR